jgi:23S rRNA G2445 N2-methylase RlmL
MVKLAALSTKGIEKLSIKEIEEKGTVGNISYYDGLIIFDYEGDISLLFKLKTFEDILVFVKTFTGINRYRASLRNIRHQSAKANFLKALEACKKARQIKEDISFSVKASYEGRRDYTAEEIEEEAAKGIIKHYNWKYNKEEAGDFQVNIIINPKISICGVSLDEKPLHVKNKIKTISGSLKSSVACSLLRIAEVNKGDIILDPMCGSGIIAIESALLGTKTIAGDIDETRLLVAKENSDSKGANIEFHLWDARKTGLPINSIDKIICNLPFDKQVKLEEEDTFFFDFLNEMNRILKQEGKLVLLTAHSDLLKKIISQKNNLKLEKEYKLINSGLVSDILVIIKN